MTYCSSLVAACLNVMAECDVVSLCTDTCIMRNIHVLFCYTMFTAHQANINCSSVFIKTQNKFSSNKQNTYGLDDGGM